MITILKGKDLWISHSWYNSGVDNTKVHGISGHVFEIIEYYYHLKKYFSCGILWPELLSKNEIQEAITSKYNFSIDEINDIFDNSKFHQFPKLLKGSNILLVDGEFKRLRNTTLLFDNVIGFSCGEKSNYTITDNKYHILQDERDIGSGQIYKSGPRTYNYTKKLLLKNYKIPKKIKNRTLLYLTGNCRQLPLNEVKKITNKGKFLIATDEPERYSIFKSNKIEVKKLPIKDFHQEFNKYL